MSDTAIAAAAPSPIPHRTSARVWRPRTSREAATSKAIAVKRIVSGIDGHSQASGNVANRQCWEIFN